MAGSNSVPGSRHAGPMGRRSRVPRGGNAASGSKAGSPPLGSSREPLAGNGSRHRRIGRRRGVLPVPDGSSIRRVGLPHGDHRAGVVDRSAQWNPLPIGNWQSAPDSSARWMDDDGPSLVTHGRINEPSTAMTPQRGHIGRWVILGGLVGAALLGAGSVAIMAAAGTGNSEAPDAAPVGTTITSFVVESTGNGSTPASPAEPSSALQIPAPGVVEQTATTSPAQALTIQGQTTAPSTTAPSTAALTAADPATADPAAADPSTADLATADPSTTDPSTAAIETPGPATVSVLTPGDSGFGWPSDAFGSAATPTIAP